MIGSSDVPLASASANEPKYEMSDASSLSTSSRWLVFHWNWYALMKFQPARQVAAPHSKTAGVYACASPPAPAQTPSPIAPVLKSLTVHTSGDGGGTEMFAGAAQALPIVENDDGSQNTCTPMPCARMSVCRMPLMRNVESMLATP